MDRTMYEEQMSNEQTSLPYAINLKQSFLLDFNNVRSRQAPVDMGIIKLGSPDLERLLVQQDGSVVTALTPTTQILFPKSVTEEQEAYARGFIDALDELHRSQGKPLNNSSMVTLDTDINTSSRNVLLLNHCNCENEFTTLMSAKTFSPGMDGDHNSVISYNSRLLNGVSEQQLNNIGNNNSKSPTSSLPPAQTLLNRISTIQQKQQKNLLQQQTSLNLTVTTITPSAQNNNIAINSNSSNNINTNPNKVVTSNVTANNNSNVSSSQSFIKTSFSSQLRPPSSSSSTSLLSTAATPNLNSNNTSNQLNLIDKDLISINLKNLFNNASNLFNINNNILHNNNSSLLLSEETLQTVPRLLSSSPLQSTSSAASLSGDSPSPASLSNCDESERLEMKRARNRLAAQKCRTRKLERIAVLSARVDELKEQNAKLERLKLDAARRVEELKEALMRHAECGATRNDDEEEVITYRDIEDHNGEEVCGEDHEMMIPVDLKM
ncbi:hypothetical protein HELRODRAFT_173259 [Helobdella robusta]|uniref:BZIP domain-containing protein n=1 Tax=Helobdella robusta TaxID=6412 RepID=T1F6M1_HELRO|nr:hypothetical protein HELRODRAFT_173259 [Helobdella robusta]ESO03558.1 hypothetical protein HELRODRAFT_173259 [Helobdella robusta]